MSALALRLAVDPAAIAESQTSKKGSPQPVPAKTMEAHLVKKVNPTYPVEAKKAGILGTVVLDAIISKTGQVENLKVVSGPSELQKSSLDAVRQWTYKPVLLNGAPIDVETTIHVVYTLQK